MEAKTTIAQPFCVFWSHEDRDQDNEVIKWLRAEVKNALEIIILGSNSLKVTISGDDNDHQTFSRNACLFLFEDARDALLFKLTWGGK